MSDGNGFTNKEILLRLEAKVDRVLDEHDDRISRLERAWSYAKGAIALGAAIAPIAILFVR